ncbi:GNAT family N-acetyltransferase [Cerasibacillus terrae]|uniref:GNAT family N-acetyltransferase n=1 Tax=Cerasibacillus terrae TaxID=2498845 RepID=A0A5C8NXH0_9BACI|nr:GNAT family N-acetyltransferase [Cerasibacillus terrae]TXL65711.1 GNAT family N-acetyltransferase [Cerasibacillus terrae]
MELHTDRLRVIPCTNELLSTISTEDYEIGPHINLYVEKLEEDSALLGWGVWFVFDKGDRVIGDIGFKGKPNGENTVEIGYGIVPIAQNKGYATEAVQALIDWAFSTGNVERIVAECRHDNLPSIRVLEKLQMTRVKLVNGLLKWELTSNP